MKAFLKNYRQSPRKVRLVADLVRGRRVSDALLQLEFLPKRASRAVAKLITSASANAEHNFKVKKDDLVIREIRVDEGATLKRFQPVSRGRAHRINKRTSHISISVAPADVLAKKEKTTAEAAETKASDKKTAKKTTKAKAADKKVKTATKVKKTTDKKASSADSKKVTKKTTKAKS